MLEQFKQSEPVPGVYTAIAKSLNNCVRTEDELKRTNCLDKEVVHIDSNGSPSKLRA